MNTLRLTEVESAPPPRAGVSDPIESWLGVLGPLLEGPGREREGVLDELRDHLTQRVRDLMLGGVRESDAVGTALSELGDASAFARQWSSARLAPRRRLVMGITAGLAVVGVAMGITAMSLLPARAGTTVGIDEPTPVPVAVFQPGGVAGEGGRVLEELRVSGMAGDTWEQFTREVGEKMKMPVTIAWVQLGGLQIQGENGELRDTTHLGVDFAEMKLSSALRLLNEARGLSALSGVDARVIDGCLVFSTAAAFDKAESVLVTYDLSGMPDIDVRGEAGTQEQIKDAIQAMVEPEHWATSGGDRATVAEVGTKLFIKAPKRMHKQVEWVLSEIKSTGKVEGDKALGHPLGDVRAAASDHEPGERVYSLATMSGKDFRDLLDLYFDTAPGLKECDFAREWETGERTLRLKASARQVELGERLLTLVDQPIRAVGEANRVTRSLPLKHADAERVAGFLKKAVVMTATFRGAAHPCSILADARTNTVIAVGVDNHLATIEGLISLVDLEAPGAADRGASAGVDPTVVSPASLTGVRRNAVPVLGDLPLINRLFTSESSAPIVIRAEGGLLRVTAPDGTSIETAELKFAPVPAGR